MKLTMTEKGWQTSLPYGELLISPEDEYGFRPYQLFVSSIAACSGGILKQIFLKKRLSFEQIMIDADVTREETGAKKITDIHLHFTIVDTEATDEQIEKMLALSETYCSMIQSVKGSIHVTKSFTKK